MYYLPTPFLYQMQGQVFMFPPLIQPNMIFQGCSQKKEQDPQEPSIQKKYNHSNNEIDFLGIKNLSTVSKPVQQKKPKNCADSDYEPQKSAIFIFYKKKNTQSNLSNQIYSFFSSPRSFDLMLKLFEGNKQKVEDLYRVIKAIKKSNKRYMNRNYISELLLLKEGGTNFKIFKRTTKLLNAQEIRKALRISFRYFMANVCPSKLLTSKKINRYTVMQHLIRKRQIIQYMNEEMLGEKSGDN